MKAVGRRAVRSVRRLAASTATRVGGPRVSVLVVVRPPFLPTGPWAAALARSLAVPAEVVLVAQPGDACGALPADVLEASRRSRALTVVQPAVHESWLQAAVAAARGRYLLFLDTDHEVDPHGLARLLRAARSSGADLVVGRAEPAPSSAPVRSGTVGPRGVAAERPELLLDLALGHRLLRSSSWPRTLRPVSGYDAAAEYVATLLLTAEGVVVTDDVVERAVDGRRRTVPVPDQSAFQAGSVRAAREGLRRAAEVVGRHAPGALLQWRVGLLAHVLPSLYLRAVPAGPAFHRELAGLAAELVGGLADVDLEAVPVQHRIAAHVAAHGTWQQLASLMDLLADNPHGLPMGRDDGRDRVRLPPDLQDLVPHACRDIRPVDRTPHLRLDEEFVDGDRWALSGAAFCDYTLQRCEVRVEILGKDGDRVVPAVQQVTDQALNQWAMRAHEDHAGAGFRVVVDPASLPERAEEGWHLEVSWAGALERRTVRPPARRDTGSGAEVRVVSYGSGELILEGVSGPRPSVVRLHGPRTVSGGVVETDGSRFRCRVPCGEGAHGLDLGRWRLELAEAGGRAVRAWWGPGLMADPPELGDDRRRLVLSGQDAAPTISVTAPLSAAERGAYGQQQLRTAVYAAASQTAPGLVLLESFHGRSTGDNPGAVARELARRQPQLDLVWVVDDPTVAAPDGMRVVHRRTRAWYEALARCHAYVANAAAPYFFEKRTTQIHLQTWHGTPLKRIGEDRGPGDFRTWRHRRRVNAQAARWDAMLSPSPYCSEIFRSAFRYDGPFWEIGYPRNDALLGPDAAADRDRIRSRLGLAPADRVVLYAPTWRALLGDRESKPMYLDADLLTRSCPEVVLLVRGHYTATRTADLFTGHPRVHDVTRYPDIADLYLAADVLVTDYSSVMFDFVLTDRPIVLLTPDLEQYREVERGFYFDLEEDAPGPLTRTTAGVVEALSGPDTDADRRARFRSRFCPYEDGRSAARAVDRLMDLW